MPECTPASIEKPGFTIGQIVRQFVARFIEKYRPGYRIKTILGHIANCKMPCLRRA
jgi:hypothetical protein